MESILKWSGLVALVIVTIIGLSKLAGVQQGFGSTSCTNITCLSGGLRLISGGGGDFESDVAAIFGSTTSFGTSGTALTQVLAGTCTATTSTATFTATTTKTHNCAATGVLAGDKVIAELPASGAVFGALQVVSATTTEANFFHFDILDLTGAATSSYPQATSTVAYWIYR